MARRKSAASRLEAPFLRSIALRPAEGEDRRAYPFSIPVLAAGDFRIDFTTPVTILAGPNGSGKSTILEAIAGLCGFGREGGGSAYYRAAASQDEILSRYLRAAWLPKVTRGFYTRAETLQGYMEQFAAFQKDASREVLTDRSHGEAYLTVFGRYFSGEGIYIFDEPEAALSPSRQIDFLRQLKQVEDSRRAQVIIATHSPLMMAYPGATLLHLTDQGLIERPFQTTDHFRVLREFYLDPEGFIAAVLEGQG
ncbi:MAG: ATP-binding protein [Caulobacter sp.]|nr:ATP-binding protein [Caulobacter sp.]